MQISKHLHNFGGQVLMEVGAEALLEGAGRYWIMTSLPLTFWPEVLFLIT